MIFLAPLWSLDVQAQAIKRVHRIGQTKPTHIETLVMEGTYEEDTVNRAASVRSDTEGDLYTREMIKVHWPSNCAVAPSMMKVVDTRAS